MCGCHLGSQPSDAFLLHTRATASAPGVPDELVSSKQMKSNKWQEAGSDPCLSAFASDSRVMSLMLPCWRGRG